MDIAPLGFSVDTTPLDDAGKVADSLAPKLDKVADSADKIGKAHSDSTAKVREATEAHRQHTIVINDHAQAVEHLKQKTMEAAAVVPRNLHAEQAFHDMNARVSAHIQPTKYDIEAAAKAEKAIQAQTNALAHLISVADPAAAKLLKLEQAALSLGKAFDTGQFKGHEQQYFDMLDKIGKAQDKLSMPVDGMEAKALSRHTPGKEILNELAYSIPGMGRQARGIAAAVGEGAGVGQVAELVGGAVVGIGVLETVRTLVTLIGSIPGEMKKAHDEADMLDGVLRSMGDSTTSGMAGLVKMADQTGLKIGEMADKLRTFEASLVRVQAQGVGGGQQKLAFQSLVDAGRIDGLSQSATLGEVDKIAPLLDKAKLSATDLASITNAMPTAIELIARGMGTTAQHVRDMAAAGELSGKTALTALANINEEANKRADAMGKSVEQNANEFQNKYSDTFKSIDEATKNSPFWTYLLSPPGFRFGFWNTFKLDAARALNEIAGGAETDPTMEVKPEPTRYARRKAQYEAAHPAAPTGDLSDIHPQKAVAEHKRKVAEAEAAAALAASNAADQVGDKYNVSKSRDDIQADVKVLEEHAAALEKSGDKSKTAADKLALINRELQAARAELKLPDTPFVKLKEQADDLVKSLAAGAGGAATLEDQAQRLFKSQDRTRQGELASLDQIRDKLREIGELEMRKDIQNRNAQANIANAQSSQIYNDSVLGDKPVDQLDLAAHTEATTLAFQKFGEAGLKNTDILNAMTDAIYRQKIAQQDIADATQAASLKISNAMTAEIIAMRLAGASEAEIHRVQDQAMIDQNGLKNYHRRVAASKDQSYATSDDPAMGGGTPDLGSVQRVGHGNINSSVYSYFEKLHGPEVAKGIAAAIMAESGSDPNAVNSTSGAYGLTQLLGKRKTGLFAKYGAHPSWQNQLDYTEWELQGHDPGGHKVLNSHGAADTAWNMLKYFERPGAGLGGDWTRAQDALGIRVGGKGRGGTAVAGGEGGKYTVKGQPGEEEGWTLEGAAANNAFALQVHSQRDVTAATTIQGLERQSGMENPAQAKALIEARKSGDEVRIHAAELDLKIFQLRASMADTTDPEGYAKRVENAERILDASQKEQAIADMLGKDTSYTDDLREQLGLLRFSGDELMRQEAMVKRRHELEKAGIGEGDPRYKAGMDSARQAAEAARVMNDQISRVRDLEDAFHKMTDSMGNDLLKAFNTAFTGGKGAGKAFLQAIENDALNMLDKIIQKMVLSPIMKAINMAADSLINSLLGSATGGGGTMSGSDFAAQYGTGGSAYAGPNAYGGAFDGGIKMFASGGVVQRPTLFPMAGGSTGMMGEAGPEAILPLARGADGRLGVAGAGGGGGGSTTVQIIDQRGAKESAPIQVEERQSGDGMRQLKIMVRDAVKDSIRRTEFDTDFSSQYGLGRSVARR